MNGRPVKVAAVLGKWQGYGVETLVYDLARHIDPAQVSITFVAQRVTSDVRKSVDRIGHRVVEMPPYHRMIDYYRSLGREFRRTPYDIVHAHTSTMAGFPLRAAKSVGIKVRIAHVHTTAGQGEHVKNLIKRALRPTVPRYATDIATSSRQAAVWMYGKKADSADGVFYLPVARDLEEYRYREDVRRLTRAELGLRDELCVGHFGRFVHQKNHSFLVEVFASILEIEPTARLILAGTGPLLSQIKKDVVNRGMVDSVAFLGHRTDAAALYQALDAFVLPSFYEGVPGTGVEAQAAGLPFVYADTITDEIDILPSTHRLRLAETAGTWASVTIESARRPRSPDAIRLMEEAGFDVATAANQLVDYYIRLTRRVRS